MYSKVNLYGFNGTLAFDYYDIPDREGTVDTRIIKPLSDALESKKMRPNFWIYPAGATMGGHRQQEQEELYVVLDGDLTFEIEDREVSAERGDVIVIEPTVWRKMTAHQDSLLLIIGAPNKADDAIADPDR